MIQALSRLSSNLTSSYRLLLLNTARAHKKFQECVSLSAGNKLVSESLLSQMMKAGWIDYGVTDLRVQATRRCSSNVHTEVLPYTLQPQLNVFPARDT